MSPSLGIVIVNWNSYQVTKDCLTSLRKCEYSNFEIILVDNGSEDGSGDELKNEFREVTLLKNNENKGFTGGNNRGIEYALKVQKDLIMLLNNDTIVTPDFAELLVNELISRPEVGAIQPKILFNQERDVIWNAGTKYNKAFSLTKTVGTGEIDQGQYDKAKEVPWITGCCFLVRSSLVRTIGGLDDVFFIYYEDTDWSFRIRNAGHKLLYYPTAKIYHEVGKSNENRETFGEGNQSPFTHFITVRNHIFISRRYAKSLNKLTSFIYQCYKIFGYTLYFLVRGRFRKLKASIKGFYHGYRHQVS